jgi:hypothetical protein
MLDGDGIDQDSSLRLPGPPAISPSAFQETTLKRMAYFDHLKIAKLYDERERQVHDDLARMRVSQQGSLRRDKEEKLVNRMNLTLREKEERLEQERKKLAQRVLEDEMKECTFKPVTNSKAPKWSVNHALEWNDQVNKKVLTNRLEKSYAETWKPKSEKTKSVEKQAKTSAQRVDAKASITEAVERLYSDAIQKADTLKFKQFEQDMLAKARSNQRHKQLEARNQDTTQRLSTDQRDRLTQTMKISSNSHQTSPIKPSLPTKPRPALAATENPRPVATVRQAQKRALTHSRERQARLSLSSPHADLKSLLNKIRLERPDSSQLVVSDLNDDEEEPISKDYSNIKREQLPVFEENIHTVILQSLHDEDHDRNDRVDDTVKYSNFRNHHVDLDYYTDEFVVPKKSLETEMKHLFESSMTPPQQPSSSAKPDKNLSNIRKLHPYPEETRAPPLFSEGPLSKKRSNPKSSRSTTPKKPPIKIKEDKSPFYVEENFNKILPPEDELLLPSQIIVKKEEPKFEAKNKNPVPIQSQGLEPTKKKAILMIDSLITKTSMAVQPNVASSLSNQLEMEKLQTNQPQQQQQSENNRYVEQPSVASSKQQSLRRTRSQRKKAQSSASQSVECSVNEIDSSIRSNRANMFQNLIDQEYLAPAIQGHLSNSEVAQPQPHLSLRSNGTSGSLASAENPLPSTNKWLQRKNSRNASVASHHSRSDKIGDEELANKFKKQQ